MRIYLEIRLCYECTGEIFYLIVFNQDGVKDASFLPTPER